MKILVTGGLGFIGSETAISLIKAGHTPIIVDNLYNAKASVVNRIEAITGVRPEFYQIDVCDKEKLDELFSKTKVEAVIHFAGYKAVGESVAKPLMYYRNNLDSTLSLLECMLKHDVKNIIFSSSATIYGSPDSVPLRETSPRKEATNPYGQTKVIIEKILEDVTKVNEGFHAVLLRYFNPIGAHPSGLLGEDPNGIPNNLMPYISQVSIGKLPKLRVFGDDYKTVDGTGVRDYIHVLDLAEGHVAALKALDKDPGVYIYNLGTGRGTSVLELVKAFEEATGIKIPYEIAPRRAGDVDAVYANCDKAYEELGWKAKLSIKDACKDSYNFQKKNPNGIED